MTPTGSFTAHATGDLDADGASTSDFSGGDEESYQKGAEII